MKKSLIVQELASFLKEQKKTLETWSSLKEKITKFKRDKQERIRVLMDQSVLWEMNNFNYSIIRKY